MAHELLPHCLGGDAELLYTRALPDAAGRRGGAWRSTYPDAVNWFLLSYAEPHTLALAQPDSGKAAKVDGETVEAWCHHLLELSELSGKIQKTGTMKQQLIMGLFKHVCSGAHVYNRADCSY